MLSSATPATKDDVKNDSVLVKDYFQQMETFLQSFGKKRFYKIFYYKLLFRKHNLTARQIWENSAEKHFVDNIFLLFPFYLFN